MAGIIKGHGPGELFTDSDHIIRNRFTFARERQTADNLRDALGHDHDIQTIGADIGNNRPRFIDRDAQRQRLQVQDTRGDTGKTHSFNQRIGRFFRESGNEHPGFIVVTGNALICQVQLIERNRQDPARFTADRFGEHGFFQDRQRDNAVKGIASAQANNNLTFTGNKLVHFGQLDAGE